MTKKRGSILSPEEFANQVPQVGVNYTPSAALGPLVQDKKTRQRLRTIDIRLSASHFREPNRRDSSSKTNHQNAAKKEQEVVRKKVVSASIPTAHSPPRPCRDVGKEDDRVRINNQSLQPLQSGSLERPVSLSSLNEISPSFNVYRFHGKEAGMSDSQLISPHLELDGRLVNAWLRDIALASRSPVCVSRRVVVHGENNKQTKSHNTFCCFLLVTDWTRVPFCRWSRVRGSVQVSQGKKDSISKKHAHSTAALTTHMNTTQNELKFVSTIAMDSNIRQAAALITRTARYCMARHQHLASMWQAHCQVMAAILTEFAKTAQLLSQANERGIVETLQFENEDLRRRVEAAEKSRDEIRADLQDML